MEVLIQVQARFSRLPVNFAAANAEEHSNDDGFCTIKKFFPDTLIRLARIGAVPVDWLSGATAVGYHMVLVISDVVT